MKTAAVIGYPIAHSLSPQIHGFWLKEKAINGRYEAKEVAPENLHDFLKNDALNLAGFNVTLPFKEQIFDYIEKTYGISHITPLAQKIGAVNTITVKDNQLWGDNSDAFGFWENIKEKVTDKSCALILGAGGASRAIIAALEEQGFKQIIVVNRNFERAQSLSQHFAISPHPWKDAGKLLAQSSLVVNCTSLGMRGKPPLALDLSPLPLHSLVTDIVYTPLYTPLLKQAQALGNPTQAGLGMLLHQARLGFANWFGQEAYVSEALTAHIERLLSCSS